MSHPRTDLAFQWAGAAATSEDKSAAEVLLAIVDAGLCGVLFVAPYFFGGRHDFGRLLLVGIIAITTAAWFARQAILPAGKERAGWPQMVAYAILLLAAALLMLQIIPLPREWLTRLSPAAAKLLPLWTSNGETAGLGVWHTLSLAPHETTKSLAMLLSYSLLFAVVSGRLQTSGDIERLLKWIAASAVLMAVFGVVHYFTTDGRFFWLYAHPYRSADQNLSGPFINRNHFAHFLVLGIGALAAWIVSVASRMASTSIPVSRPVKGITLDRAMLWSLAAAMALVTFAVLASRSRGGAIVLLVAATVLAAVYMYRGLVDSRIVYAVVGLAVVVVGLLSLHGYDRVVQRLDDFTEGSLDEIDHGGIRRKIWAANVAAFQALPSTGAGAGSHREVLPVYMRDPVTKEYTHAENGYLQIATETGVVGVLLLIGGISVCGACCVGCLRNATSALEARLFGAAAAGLAASFVHSAVDFVWYIPACMSVTILLAASVVRLYQLKLIGKYDSATFRVQSYTRWLELAAAVAVAGWATLAFVGPGVAAIHWDRYLRTSVAEGRLKQQQMTDLVANGADVEPADYEPLNDAMLRHLEQVVRWDPRFARARLRLAAKYLAKFELSQRTAENAMGLLQIRDATVASAFTSQIALDDWLKRALGPNLQWLRLAAAEARHAVALCPLQGEGYVYLADLCFLNAHDARIAKAYIDQALRVRPHDSDVLYAVGLMADDRAGAIERWKQCFGAPGGHQLKIVYLLAGQISAAEFVAAFQPDWHTLRELWARYREVGQPQDVETLLAYSAEATRRETQQATGPRPAFVWYWQSNLYADADRPDDALACLERAYACHPRHVGIRRALAQSLYAKGRFAEAEMHVRWCLARRPTDKTLNDVLVKLAKQRLAQREQRATGIRTTSPMLQVWPAATPQRAGGATSTQR